MAVAGSRWVLLFSLCLTPVTASFGQVVTFQGGLGGSTTAFEKEQAAAEEANSQSFGVQLAAEVLFYRFFALRSEAGLEFLTPLCLEIGENFDCAEARRSSNASTGALFGALGAGLWTPPLRLGPSPASFYLSFAMYGGREWVEAGLTSEACLNCRPSDLHFQGGFYLEPLLHVALDPALGLAFTYRAYEDASDLRGRFTLRLIFRP